jgi:hypothetical protein
VNSDLKDFEKMLKICRKQGVSDLDFNGIKVKFGEMPKTPLSDSDSDYSNIETPDALSPEDLMYYSAQI